MTEVLPDPEGQIDVLDHGFVRLDAAMADDLSVVNAARVSFARRRFEMDESDVGLVKFLMRDRHGCYDDATEVLTNDGWKPWPDVTGGERFATLSLSGELEYQPALRMVRKEHKGHMIGFKGMSIDLLVTPDHRMLASPMTTREGRENPTFRLLPAHSLLWRSHRHTTTAAAWHGIAEPHVHFDGSSFDVRALFGLIGLFIGDGHLGGSNHIAFNIRKAREIAFLERAASDCRLELKRWAHVYAIPLGPELRGLFARCYGADRSKQIPRELLRHGPEALTSLLDGLIASDGTTHERPGTADRLVYHTTSKRLADEVQELALRIGRSATVRPHKHAPGDGHYGRRDRWRVAIYSGRNARPALCRTRASAQEQMGVEDYDGLIHCVEVPNRTLYVRRNGYAAWCGNTPFEHNAFRFHVRCPIFVAREWFRHRVGSFNEFSMRYARATDEFYVPEAEDVRSQVGKPGAYTFEPVEPELADRTRAELQKVYDVAYSTYEALVEAGVARELARAVLPVGSYTEFYWTVNARSLMNFLSLRSAEAAQREIRRFAEACEQLFATQMPVTYQAFVANERRAP
jgi:thymidylate synthase (FAD)